MEQVDVESVPSLIFVWREEHPRGPLPVDLRRAVARHAAEFGDAVSSELMALKPDAVKRWREEYGPKVAKPKATRRRRRRKPSFVELAAPPLSKGPALLIEVALAGGRVVRIQGALEPAALEAVIRCAARVEA